MKRSIPWSASLALWACLAAVRGAGADEAAAVPGAAWERGAPAAHGFDAARLGRACEALGGDGCVVHAGVMIASWGDITGRVDMASAGKPVLTYLLLNAVETGRIGGLDDPLVRWLPDLADLNPGLDGKDGRMTWRHLATQTSCYGLREAPGQAFAYNDFQAALFARTLLTRVYGAGEKDVDRSVTTPVLGEPLGCEDAPRLGERRVLGRLSISLRDFARFGLLWLREGRWGERRLLDGGRVRMAMRSPLPAALPRTRGLPARMLPRQGTFGGERNMEDHAGSYSYMWWVNGLDVTGSRFWPDLPADTVAALGHGGRRGMVLIPSRRLVLCWNDAEGVTAAEFVSQDGRIGVNRAVRRFLAAATGGAPPAQRSGFYTAANIRPRLGSVNAVLGRERRMRADGHMPHAVADSAGRLHVVYRDGNRLAYMTGPGWLGTWRREAVPASNRARCPWIALSPAGRPAVAWDTGKDVRLSVRTGKRWLPPAGLDCAAGWQNLFPQLVFAGEDDLYAASWCVRQGLSGRSVFYRLRRGPRSWTADTILRYGSSMFRPPSLASSSSSAAADGTGASVYAVLASPFIRLPRIRDDRIDLAGEVVVQSCGFDLAEGCNGFVTRGEPGVVCAYRMGRHRQAFVLNTRSRAAAGRRPVFLGYGQGYPRAAVDALSGDVCVLFCEGTGARAAVWSPGRDVADDAGRVAEDLHRKQVRMAGRGCGAGAVAARPGGGFWIVYSRSGELWYRSLTLERPPPG